jgi:hypothetical protein
MYSWHTEHTQLMFRRVFIYFMYLYITVRITLPGARYWYYCARWLEGKNELVKVIPQ